MYASLVCSFRYFSSLICVWGKGAIDSCWKWKPRASLVAQMVKKKKKIHLQCRRPRFDPWVRKIPRRREWLPTLVFLPGESRGQSSLAGHSPWGLYFHKKKKRRWKRKWKPRWLRFISERHLSCVFSALLGKLEESIEGILC